MKKMEKIIIIITEWRGEKESINVIKAMGEKISDKTFILFRADFDFIKERIKVKYVTIDIGVSNYVVETSK